MNVEFWELAWEQYRELEQTDRALYKKINRLIEDIRRDPFDGIGKPEPLRHELSGFWSRRIDEEHRIVYTVDENTLVIARCRGHYV